MINAAHRVYFGLLFCTQNIINHLVFWDRHRVKKIHHSFRSQSMTLEPLPKPRAPHVWRIVRSLFVRTWDGRWEVRPVTRSTSTPVNLNIPIPWNMLNKRKFYHVGIFPVFIHSFWLRYTFIENKNKDGVGVYFYYKLSVVEHYYFNPLALEMDI